MSTVIDSRRTWIGLIFPLSGDSVVDRCWILGPPCGSYPRHFVGHSDYREMSPVYSASQIDFNRRVRDDINMRVFEGLCSVKSKLAILVQLSVYCT